MPRNSPKNITRGTPGMILLAFATLLLASALVRVASAHRNPIINEAQSLTGLGDTHFYTGFSENDFYNAALIFDAAPKGLFRRSVNPVPHADGGMLRHGLESTGHFIVYEEAHPGAPPSDTSPTRRYLKAGDNLYVEFGERNHWPAFKTR